MSRRLNAFDRFVTLLVAVALGALAFFAFDWRYGWVFSYPEQLSTGPVTSATEATWFPWAFAGVAVVLGLLALWWLGSHLRRPHESTIRLRGSSNEGRLNLDLSSLASAAADRFGELAGTDSVRGRTRTIGSHQVVEIAARLDPRSDGPSVAAAARTCAADVAAALPDGDATCRVLVDAPRGRGGRGKTATVGAQ